MVQERQWASLMFVNQTYTWTGLVNRNQRPLFRLVSGSDMKSDIRFLATPVTSHIEKIHRFYNDSLSIKYALERNRFVPTTKDRFDNSSRVIAVIVEGIFSLHDYRGFVLTKDWHWYCGTTTNCPERPTKPRAMPVQLSTHRASNTNLMAHWL